MQRPDLVPPAMTVNFINETAVSDGYIFMTPYQEYQAGPYIFDKRGVRTTHGPMFKIYLLTAAEPHLVRLQRDWSLQRPQLSRLRMDGIAPPLLVSRQPTLRLRTGPRINHEPRLQGHQDGGECGRSGRNGPARVSLDLE